MDRRLELHEKLVEILGSRNVYFQPPASINMSYPAIRYVRSDINNNHADDLVYAQSRKYELTVLDFDPDSDIVTKVSQLPTARWIRSYQADGLNHDIIEITY